MSGYLQYYGLTEAPFTISPNPRFLYLSAKHHEALNHLLYGIRERKGFVQLTGEVGAGKTTLCRALLEQLPCEQYSTALILNPVLQPDQMMAAIATEFGLGPGRSCPWRVCLRLRRYDPPSVSAIRRARDNSH